MRAVRNVSVKNASVNCAMKIKICVYAIYAYDNE